MRKVFFVGLIAMLTGCSQESRVSSPEDSGIELQINLSLGSVSTRAVDDPITGNDGEGYVLPFTEVKTLKVDLYKSLEAAPIFTYTATDAEIAGIRNTATGKLARLSIPKIPVTTQYVKVTINRFKEENPLINQLQVSSQDDPPAPTMNRTEIPYEGVTKEIIVIPEESDPFSVKVKAIVEVAPVLSRFEIIPGEIVVTNPATTGASFDWTDGPIGKSRTSPKPISLLPKQALGRISGRNTERTLPLPLSIPIVSGSSGRPSPTASISTARQPDSIFI